MAGYADKPQTGLICGGYKGVLSLPDEGGVIAERIGVKSSDSTIPDSSNHSSNHLLTAHGRISTIASIGGRMSSMAKPTIQRATLLQGTLDMLDPANASYNGPAHRHQSDRQAHAKNHK
jgi:hypothetical protein